MTTPTPPAGVGEPPGGAVSLGVGDSDTAAVSPPLSVAAKAPTKVTPIIINRKPTTASKTGNFARSSFILSPPACHI